MGGALNNSAAALGSFPPERTNWKQKALLLHTEARVFYFVFRHPRSRWYARVIAAFSIGYVVSPIQLIPSFIPVVGFLDDALVLYLGSKLLRKVTPPDILAECRESAKLPVRNTA